MRTAIISAQRNEGLYLLEWLAYHRVLGFDRVIIASNDCTDGSDILLDRLQDAGIVTHIRHSPPAGCAPQDSAMRLALRALDESPADWVLHCDADEYLWLSEGTSLKDLLQIGADADVIALPWCAFGDSGIKHWPGATLPHFTQREIWPNPQCDKFKSLFRPQAFGHANDHMPMQPKVAAPKAVSTNGDPLQTAQFFSDKHHSRYRPLEVSLKPGPARLNHYAIRSQDSFLARETRGDGQGKDGSKYRLGSRWHKIANRNDVEDRSILTLWPQVLTQIARLHDLRGVTDAERACKDYSRRLFQKVSP